MRIHLRRANRPGFRRNSSVRARLLFLLGDRFRSVAALVVASVLAGLTESAILATVAQGGAALVDREPRVHVTVGSVHLALTVGLLLSVALGLAVARLALQAPISILPARIAANVQSQLRRGLFDAFTRASWEKQSRDREGHLQELMSNQVAQASLGASAATSLVTAVVTLVVLMISAVLLDPIAAAVVLVAAIALFELLRPLNQLGARQSRALSAAQMSYASGVSEATRIAEETKVFGVASAQREHVHRLVDDTRLLFFRTQLVARLVPNIYQSVIYLIVVVGLLALHETNAGHIGSLGAVVLLLVRAGGYGQQVQAGYQGVRQGLPYVERLQEAQRSYALSSPRRGSRPLGAIHTVSLEDVSFAYAPHREVLTGITFEVARGNHRHRRPVGRRQVDPRADSAAAQNGESWALSHQRRGGGPIRGRGLGGACRLRSARAAAASCIGRRQHPVPPGPSQYER